MQNILNIVNIVDLLPAVCCDLASRRQPIIFSSDDSRSLHAVIFIVVVGNPD